LTGVSTEGAARSSPFSPDFIARDLSALIDELV
jgi:hypothetical protein